MQAAQQDPYADPAAPYKADRWGRQIQRADRRHAKSITVLTKEILRDKDATSLKEVGRTTAGVTIGTGEGGNAFGDRFFIRGFDARNDVFVDGIRDPAVNIRENFFTEQIEILKGPSATINGRGTAGGAINIVTKQATTRPTSTTPTRRLRATPPGVSPSTSTRSLLPTLAIRMDGMWQNANVSERDVTSDDRWGGLAAVKWTPTNVKRHGQLHPHQLWWACRTSASVRQRLRLPVTSMGVPRDTYYGFENRDFQKPNRISERSTANTSSTIL